MSGALGTVVLTGVTSGVLSIVGVVEAASTPGEVVPVSVSCSGVVTTTGVGRAGLLDSVSITCLGVGDVEVASTPGEIVLVSVSFSGVVTTTSVGRDEFMDRVSTSVSGVGVLYIVDGVLEMAVSIAIGEEVGILISVSVSF